MAKTPPRKPANDNAALLQKLVTTQAKAEDANARVNLVRAQIQVKGKEVVYDYSKPGPAVLKVVDRQKGVK